jgi:dynein heavy chain, axonemal
VNHNLFKGFLLAPHQIEATSKRRDKVAEVEVGFLQWMKKIKSVVAQGHHIVRDGPKAGPLVELEHWRRMLTYFNNVVEFTDSRPFQSYKRCLKLSRSKFIPQWKDTESNLIVLLNEARDNVRFMQSIEKFWDPLYRCKPLEIIDNLLSLLQAVRTVFNSSRFYNTNFRITGLLSKVVNQLIVASKGYLTIRGNISIWDEDNEILIKKIEECKKLKAAMRASYTKILCQMIDAGEAPFECSEKFLFERYESFERRLNKIREVAEILMRYQVLNKIRVAGLEVFAKRIEVTYKAISGKPYDPLDHRLEDFDIDYVSFQAEINSVEMGMEVFVKRYVEKIESVEMRLVTLKRFEQLNLDCLCLDRRFLDVAVLLEKEIEDIKDKYNEERANPPIGRNIPPVIGRIRWSRTLLQKMEQPLNILRNHECVIQHPKAQLSVKFYNYLAGILLHYEVMHHKSWFSYAESVRSRLEVPLIRKNPESNCFELNLDWNVLQVIKETELMWKMDLAVPDTANVLAYCKDRVAHVFNMTKALVERNNKLRKSIYPIFTPLMRIQLVKLERVFVHALSTATWLTENLDEYFQEVINVLRPIEEFLKQVSDINDAQIELAIKAIEDAELVILPEGAVTPKGLEEMNVEHRQKIEKRIQMKSLAAERSAIDMITKFIDQSGVPTWDDSGKFQLPPNQITTDNWRVEEFKPIDKYDWLSFGKLYKAVGYASPEENEKLVFEEYDGLKYDVTLLHIDCVELFAYYNHKIIAALAKCTKRSMEMLKQRANISAQVDFVTCDGAVKALLIASIELRIPDFELVPKMPDIQKHYEATLVNIIETNYAIETWGNQAKTEERKNRKPLIDEIRHERSFFKLISEHKEVMRYKMTFDNGVMQLEMKVKSILKQLKAKYSYLWSEKKEEEIENFVAGNPLTADIRDKFQHYDKITEDISKLTKVLCVRTIEVDQTSMIDALMEESKSWKSILGAKSSDYYRKILEETSQFIQKQQKKLERKIIDLDDCRNAMDCLKTIRENSHRIDDNLTLLAETYAMFAAFHISIPQTDLERVEDLPISLNALVQTAQGVYKELFELQGPLLKQLFDGVEKFKEDLVNYNEGYLKQGPMVVGIEAKEAIDRLLLYDVYFQELTKQNEIYSDGEKLFGLPVLDFPLLQKRREEIDFLHEFYKLHFEVLRCIEAHSETLVKDARIEELEKEFLEFSERFKAFEIPKDIEDWPNINKLKTKIEYFLEICPLLKLLTIKEMKEDHWEMLEVAMYGYNFEIDSGNFNLGIVFKAPLLNFDQSIEAVHEKALKDDEKRQERRETLRSMTFSISIQSHTKLN